MKAIVEELVALVGGHPKGVECDASPAIKALQAKFHSELAAPVKKIKKLPVHKAKEVSPEQIIPMDEDNFKDF